SIHDCNEIRYMWESEAKASKVLVNLRTLKVGQCSKLVSLGEKEEEDNCNQLTSLRILELDDCKKLERCNLPNNIEELSIYCCERLLEKELLNPSLPAMLEVDIDLLLFLTLSYVDESWNDWFCGCFLKNNNWRWNKLKGNESCYGFLATMIWKDAANGNFDRHPSYVGVVKQKMMFQPNRDDDNNPSIVLDESCVLQCDYSFSLMGKVLDFGSLSNLKMVLTKEEYASNTFLIDERVVWVNIEGVPLKVWTNNTFNKISSKWGKMLFEEDKKNLCLNSKRVCIKTKLENNIFESFKIIVNGKVFWIRAKEVCSWVPDFLEEEEEGDESDEDTFDDEFGKDNSKAHMNFNSEGDSDKEEIQETVFSSHKAESKGRDDINDVDDVIISEDPFKIYDMLEKQKLQGNNVEDDISNGVCQNANEHVNNVEEKSNKGMSSSKEEDKESRCSWHFRSVEGPQTGGSILQMLDDVVKVGQTMGYKMDGCVSNIEEIIKSHGENEFYQ
nr:hypothetical protein [Tanacetum cinerariifolium]